MQALTTKELEYISDSMSNEDLLVKQMVATAVHTNNQGVRNLMFQLADRHQQHYQHLVTVLQQHESIAPGQGQ